MNTDMQQQLGTALAQLEAGFADDAMESIQLCLRDHADDPMVRLVEARIQLARCQPRQTLAALASLDRMEGYEADSETRLLRLRALFQAGRWEQGDALLARMCEEKADARVLKIVVARALQKGDTGGAVEGLRRLVACDVSDVGARQLLALLVAQEDAQRGAEVLESQSSGESERLTIARLYHKAGRLRDAADVYEQLLKAEPRDAVIWLEAGMLADELGDAQAAVSRLQRAIALGGPRCRAAMRALARAHMHGGQFAAAARCWWRLMREDETDLVARSGLVICALAAKRPTAARKAMRRLQQSGTRHERRLHLAQHWRHAAAALVDAAQPNVQAMRDGLLKPLLEDAARTFETHGRQYDNRADTFYHLGICHEALDDTNRAALAAEGALRINPKYAAALELSRRVA